MIPTLIGAVTVLVGLWLLFRRSPLDLLCAVMALGVLEGSAALILTAIGSSSIPPGRVMLAFLILSCLHRFKDDAQIVGRAAADNGWLILFCVYGFISAFFLPRIFAGQMDVVPMRSVGLRHLLDAFPLRFTPQNITTGVYLIGTALAALCSYLAVFRAKSLSPIVTAAIWISAVHAVTGVLGVALRGTPWDLVVDFFRNGSYSQLSQATEDFVRMGGLMPEPSNFARFGLAWFILCFELWLRHIRPTATGLTAALMGLVLVASTSSTAYVGLAGYALLIAVRMAFAPAYLRVDKLVIMAFVAIAGVIAFSVILSLMPDAAHAFEKMLRQMTMEKADSASGQQRAFWAKQGIDAFILSYGLGIGAGSFRSSSLLMAILGSMGVVGIVSFLAYVARLLRPVRQPAARPDASGEIVDIANSVGWAAVASLIPALAIQPSPDPGMEFACFAGIAIGLKARAVSTQLAAIPLVGNFVSPPRAPAAPAPTGWRHVSK
ncbi:hypothetical protein ATE67_13340 [Sphingopyxis sp. H050]|jgi:O-Antigen ligase|uniref:O-antigen ligase family protein n=1 Tax=Sphingopyxis sp. H050 TaxID=1759072 RepID=UPI00073CB1F8|nr:O-antigen ligase family protein [Sphingopyxis sp. H050]KTE19633.1 hypothetical protein ATE67_13340 [Sphingopyxis sp. H050]